MSSSFLSENAWLPQNRQFETDRRPQQIKLPLIPIKKWRRASIARHRETEDQRRAPSGATLKATIHVGLKVKVKMDNRRLEKHCLISAAIPKAIFNSVLFV